MTAMNLTAVDRATVQSLVDAADAADVDEFMYTHSSRFRGYVFDRGHSHQQVEGSDATLQHLADEGLVSLRRGGADTLFGSVRQAARDALANGFQVTKGMHMQEYNLTPNVREILRKMVAASRALDTEAFTFTATFNSSRFAFRRRDGREQMVDAEPEQVDHLVREGLITLRPGGGGALNLTAFKAVDNGFVFVVPMPTSVTNNGVVIHGGNHGNVVGATGDHARAVQHVRSEGDHDAQVARLADLTVQLIAAVRAALPDPTAAAPVVAAIEAAGDAAGRPSPDKRASANEAGAALTNWLKVAAAAGPAVAGVDQISYTLTGWIHALTTLVTHG